MRVLPYEEIYYPIFQLETKIPSRVPAENPKESLKALQSLGDDSNLRIERFLRNLEKP